MKGESVRFKNSVEVHRTCGSRVQRSVMHHSLINMRRQGQGVISTILELHRRLA